MTLLSEWWTQIWPNLVASVLWATPLFIWHHRRIRKHFNNTIKAVTDGTQHERGS